MVTILQGQHQKVLAQPSLFHPAVQSLVWGGRGPGRWQVPFAGNNQHLFESCKSLSYSQKTQAFVNSLKPVQAFKLIIHKSSGFMNVRLEHECTTSLQAESYSAHASLLLVLQARTSQQEAMVIHYVSLERYNKFPQTESNLPFIQPGTVYCEGLLL